MKYMCLRTRYHAMGRLVLERERRHDLRVCLLRQPTARQRGMALMSGDAAEHARAAVEAVYRSDSRRVLATLIRVLGDCAPEWRLAALPD